MVVLTHDERLPESACHLLIPAHVIEVVGRLAGGVPYYRRPGDAQSLSDARTLLRTDDLPAGATARAVPLFCRLAMDAACARGEVYFPGLQIVNTSCIDKGGVTCRR